MPLQPVLSYTQHSATPLWQGSRNNCPCSSPTEPLCPTLTKVSLCLAPQLLQPRAASHSNRPSWASCSLGGLVLFHHTCKGMQSCKHTPCPPLPATGGMCCPGTAPSQSLRALQHGKQLFNTHLIPSFRNELSTVPLPPVPWPPGLLYR